MTATQHNWTLAEVLHHFLMSREQITDLQIF